MAEAIVNESIFGSDGPKMVYDLGGGSEATVLLNYVEEADHEHEIKEVIHDSELEADRTIIDRGEYINIIWKMHLHLLGTAAERRSKFEEIYQYNKSSNLYLWKHRDGSAYVDSSSNEVPFYLNVTWKPLGVNDNRDLLILRYRALKGIDLSDNSTIVIPASEIIMNNARTT